MSIWRKRNEFPEGHTKENNLYVYVFKDGIDVSKYWEHYHTHIDLKKWCNFNSLCRAEERNEILWKKLDIAQKALLIISNTNKEYYSRSTYKWLLDKTNDIAKETLEDIKRYK